MPSSAISKDNALLGKGLIRFWLTMLIQAFNFIIVGRFTLKETYPAEVERIIVCQMEHAFLNR